MKSIARRNAASGQIDVLSKSRIYRDYQRAFTEGTTLPLGLQGAHVTQLAHFPKGQESPFCALMAKTDKTCAACYEVQKRLEREAKVRPTTLKCFAGMCESSVPVRMGEKVIAFLHTGHVLLHKPSHRQFNRIASTLMKWGAETDLKELEEAYFQTRVLSVTQYEAFLRMLAIFAEHLAACSSELVLRPHRGDPQPIVDARAFIADHHAEELPLRRVAAAVNLSATYLSEMFKKTTGMTFVEYVTRMRVEKAKNLLQNPGLRVTEIAFEVGFQSLSQFNRAFKKIAGQSPTGFRTHLTAA